MRGGWNVCWWTLESRVCEGFVIANIASNRGEVAWCICSNQEAKICYPCYIKISKLPIK